MKTRFYKVFTSFLLAMVLLVGNMVPAFAAEAEIDNVDVASVNAAITLPAGKEYRMFNNGTLTFRNKTTEGPFYVEGQWLKLSFDFGTAESDLGDGGIWLTIDVINADNNQTVYTVRDYVPNKGDRAGTDFTFDLGSGQGKVRNIYLRFDASSYGTSNGHYRSATLTNVTSYVFGPV